MKTKNFLLMLTAGVAISFAACHPSEKQNMIDFEQFKAEGTYRLVGSAKVFDTDKDLTYQCKAAMVLPSAIENEDIRQLRDSIMSTAFDTTGTDIAAVAYGAFARNAADNSGFEVTDTVVPDSIYDGIYDVDGTVVHLSTRLLSYGVTVSTYSPHAAHGMYSTFYINYDIEKGKIFTLSDILTPGAMAELPGILREKAASMRGTIGDTEIETVSSDANFYIDNTGNIVFVFQPYEIASYAQGIIELPIPAYILDNSLTPYGKEILL